MCLIQGSRAKCQPDGGRFVLNPIHFLEDRLLRLGMQLQGYAPRHMSPLTVKRAFHPGCDSRLPASATGEVGLVDTKRHDDPIDLGEFMFLDLILTAAHKCSWRELLMKIYQTANPGV